MSKPNTIFKNVLHKEIKGIPLKSIAEQGAMFTWEQGVFVMLDADELRAFNISNGHHYSFVPNLTVYVPEKIDIVATF